MRTGFCHQTSKFGICCHSFWGLTLGKERMKPEWGLVLITDDTDQMVLTLTLL